MLYLKVTLIKPFTRTIKLKCTYRQPKCFVILGLL